MHHEDRDAHQGLVDQYGFEGMTFHPPTINELLEQRRRQEAANRRADILTVAACIMGLIFAVGIVLLT